MNTTTADDLVVESPSYRMTFGDLKRLPNTKTRGCNEAREDYPAYVWTGSVDLFFKETNRAVSTPFQTDRFFAEQVEYLSFQEVLRLVLIDNQLYLPRKVEIEGAATFCDKLALRLCKLILQDGDERPTQIQISPFRHGANLLDIQYEGYVQATHVSEDNKPDK